MAKRKKNRVPAGKQLISKKEYQALQQTAKQLEAIRSIIPKTTSFAPQYAEHMGHRKGAMYGSGWNGLPFETQRLVAERSILIQSIISTQIHRVLRVAKKFTGRKGDYGWKVVHKDEYDPKVNVEKIEGYKEIKQKIEDILECPHPIYAPTFSSACTQLSDDFLKINRPTVELLRNGYGEVVQFAPADGALILPTLQYLKQRATTTKMFSTEDAIQEMKKKTGVDLSGYEWVIFREGQVEGYIKPGRIIMSPLQDTTTIERVGYPSSYVEKAVVGIISFDNNFSYNSNYFNRGVMAEAILGISGDFSDQDFQAFADQIHESFSGVQGAWKLPILRMDHQSQFNLIDLKKSNVEMQFLQFMNVSISLVCSVFRVHPGSIYFVGMSTDGRAIFEHGKEKEIETSEREGFHAIMVHLALIFDRVVRSIHPDYRFEWEGLEENKEKEEQEQIKTELETWRTIDDVMLSKGKKPYKEEWSQIPLNPLIFNFVQAQKQRDAVPKGQDFGQETGFGEPSEAASKANGKANGAVPPMEVPSRNPDPGNTPPEQQLALPQGNQLPRPKGMKKVLKAYFREKEREHAIHQKLRKAQNDRLFLYVQEY